MAARRRTTRIKEFLSKFMSIPPNGHLVGNNSKMGKAIIPEYLVKFIKFCLDNAILVNKMSQLFKWKLLI